MNATPETLKKAREYILIMTITITSMFTTIFFGHRPRPAAPTPGTKSGSAGQLRAKSRRPGDDRRRHLSVEWFIRFWDLLKCLSNGACVKFVCCSSISVILRNSEGVYQLFCEGFMTLNRVLFLDVGWYKGLVHTEDPGFDNYARPDLVFLCAG